MANPHPSLGKLGERDVSTSYCTCNTVAYEHSTSNPQPNPYSSLEESVRGEGRRRQRKTGQTEPEEGGVGEVSTSTLERTPGSRRKEEEDGRRRAEEELSSRQGMPVEQTKYGKSTAPRKGSSTDSTVEARKGYR